MQLRALAAKLDLEWRILGEKAPPVADTMRAVGFDLEGRDKQLRALASALESQRQTLGPPATDPKFQWQSGGPSFATHTMRAMGFLPDPDR